MDPTCHDGVCGKCWGAKYIVIGIVFYLATWYAESNGNVYFIWYAIAVLLVLKGIMKLAMPMCGHCQPKDEAKKIKK